MPGAWWDRKDVDPTAAVRRAIGQLQDEQRRLAARIGTAVVTHAQADRALREQQSVLTRAREEILRATDLAQRAAAGARADGGPSDAAPYEQAVRGLQAQLATVDMAVEQLAGMRGTTVDTVDRARELLRRSRESLDAALREQIRLLARIERLDRARVIAEARRRSGG